MSSRLELAPGVPGDYYDRIYDVEGEHFWYRGMWSTSVAMLGARLRPDSRVLDAGCGTGGFLRYLLDAGACGPVAGTDIAAAAIAFAQTRVPEATLAVAPLHQLPFADGAFDVVASNDVLQHVPEEHVGASLEELHRVLAPGGALILRTNGSRQLREERDDWRAYDIASLRGVLETAAFSVEHVTYANGALSLAARLRGRVPHAPTTDRHGIPMRSPGKLVSVMGRVELSAERWWIARGRSVPYGHTMFALAART